MNNRFQFRSLLFNISVPRDYFINPNCFGDDAAVWMIQNLNERGIVTANEPGQEDFGWYFTFVVKDVEHCLLIGFQPNDPARGDQWIGWIERSAGFLSSIFGGRNRRVLPEAVDLIDSILRSSPHIHDVTWHRVDAN